ncbi:MAG: helix-hairpin-helix domain-containing protein [Vicinamibacteraceae bacterium]
MRIRLSLALAASALGTFVTMATGQPEARAVQPDARPAPPAAFTKVCVRCHPSDKIVEGRRYRTQWDQVLEQMVARGATGTDEEFDVIADYLVAQYGRVAINTAPADEIAQVLHLEPGLADTIVQQRSKAGPFADFAALTAVPGVPAADLEKLRDAIVF